MDLVKMYLLLEMGLSIAMLVTRWELFFSNISQALSWHTTFQFRGHPSKMTGWALPLVPGFLCWRSRSAPWTQRGGADCCSEHCCFSNDFLLMESNDDLLSLGSKDHQMDFCHLKVRPQPFQLELHWMAWPGTLVAFEILSPKPRFFRDPKVFPVLCS